MWERERGIVLQSNIAWQNLAEGIQPIRAIGHRTKLKVLNFRSILDLGTFYEVQFGYLIMSFLKLFSITLVTLQSQCISASD